MTQLLITEPTYLASIADTYQAFRTVADEALRGVPFGLLHDDHVGDVTATLARLEPRLVEDVARYVAEGNDAAAFEAVSMSLHILAKTDAHIMRRAPLWQDLYALVCEVEGHPSHSGGSDNGAIGRRSEDHRYFWIKDRMFDDERRRRQYALLHKLDAKKNAPA